MGASRQKWSSEEEAALIPIQICFDSQIIPGLFINQRNYTRRNIFSREPANEERRKEDPQRKHQNGFTARYKINELIDGK